MRVRTSRWTSKWIGTADSQIVSTSQEWSCLLMSAHVISPWWHCICWYPPSSSQLGTNTGIPDSAPAARARCFSSAHLAPPEERELFICQEEVGIKLIKYLLPSWTRQGPRCLNFTFVPLHIADWSPHL